VAWLYSFFNLGARWGWVVSTMPGPICTWDINPVPILEEAEWDAGSVQMFAENLAPTWIQSLDRPALSEFAILTTHSWSMNPICQILILLKAAIVYPFYACANIFVCHTFV